MSTTHSDEVDKVYEDAEADKLKAAAEVVAEADKGGDDVPTTPSDNVSDYNNMSLEEQVLTLIRVLSTVIFVFGFKLFVLSPLCGVYIYIAPLCSGHHCGSVEQFGGHLVVQGRCRTQNVPAADCPR